MKQRTSLFRRTWCVGARQSEYQVLMTILLAACVDSSGPAHSTDTSQRECVEAARSCNTAASHFASAVSQPDVDVAFRYNATRLETISVGGVNVLLHGYLIGSRDGTDDPVSNFSSVGSDGRNMTNGGPSFTMTFWPKRTSTLGFRVVVDPVAAKHVDTRTRQLARISFPIDLRKELFDQFAFRGTRYYLNNASSGKPYSSGTRVRYTSIPTPYPIHTTVDGQQQLLGRTGLAESKQATTWGEVVGPVATIRVNVLTSSRYRSMEFYNHFGTNNIELRFGPLGVNQGASVEGEIIVTPNGALSSPSATWSFQAETDFAHQIGRRDLDGWSARVGDQAGRYLSYGPYTRAVTSGRRTATFRLLLDNVNADNNRVLTLDVFDAASGRVLASRDVRRREFRSPFQYQDFDLPFSSAAGQLLEFRAYWVGGSYVRQDLVSVR